MNVILVLILVLAIAGLIYVGVESLKSGNNFKTQLRIEWEAFKARFKKKP